MAKTLQRTLAIIKPDAVKKNAEGDIISMQDIFLFDRVGIDEGGKVKGVFKATGVRPKFADRLAVTGCRLRPALFESRMEV